MDKRCIDPHDIFDLIVSDIAKEIDEPLFFVQNWFFTALKKIIDLDELAKEIKKSIVKTRLPDLPPPPETKAISGKTGSK